MQASEDTKVQLVDIHQIIKKANPKLYKLLPRFILRWLKKIIHQEDVLNLLIKNHSQEEPHNFCKASLDHFQTRRSVRGVENLPKDHSRMIFVSNHPLGGLDGMAFIEAVHQVYGPVKFPVNSLLLNVPALKKAFIPINNMGGKQTRDALTAMEDALKSDRPVLYFPSGMCSRKIKGEICDLEWKKSFLVQAIKHERDIVPVFINGANSNRFYNISNFRNKIKLKLNIEMLYLVDEMVKQKNKDLVISFGKPISYKTFDKSKTLNEWVDFVREKTYALNK